MSPAALDDYLVSRGTPSFDWGSSNCCHFAAGWVRHVTGRDPMLGLPETPTPMAARRLLKTLGDPIRDVLTQRLGQDPIPASMARVGDIVLLPQPGAGVGASVGVCAGRVSVFLGTDGSLVSVPTLSAECAWRLESI